MTTPRPRRPRSRATTTKPAAARRPRLPKAIGIAVEAALGKKAAEVVVLDLRKSDAFTDFFVIATGATARQVHAIADGVETALKAEQVRPSNVEGYRLGEWVLLDYFDFVVHVFSPSARSFYALERLWGTARHITIEDPEPSAAEARAGTRRG
ncbi:MAG: ribosome silencing factor [Acidobacteriota bacterium]|nr:ribosome silencing factor [Acidobacteriota bacterium]